MWFIICVYSECFMLCMSNERNEDEGTKRKNRITILNLRLYAVEQPFRWQCIPYYDEENTHNIQNTKYMKIVSYFFYIRWLFPVMVLTLCSLVHLFRPHPKHTATLLLVWLRLCVRLHLCLCICVCVLFKKSRFKKSTDQNGWNNIFDDMRIILATWAQITKINNTSTRAAVAAAAKWWTKKWW